MVNSLEIRIKRVVFNLRYLIVGAGLLPFIVFGTIAGRMAYVKAEEEISLRLEAAGYQLVTQVTGEVAILVSLVGALTQSDTLESGNAETIGKLLDEFSEAVPALRDLSMGSDDGLVVHTHFGNLRTGDSYVPLMEAFPVFEKHFKKALRREQGEVEVQWNFAGRSGQLLHAFAPITDDSNTEVIGVLVARLDLEAMFKGKNARSIGTQIEAGNFLMLDPGMLLGKSDEVLEVQSAIERAGVTRQLWGQSDALLQLEVGGEIQVVKVSSKSFNQHYGDPFTVRVLSMVPLSQIKNHAANSMVAYVPALGALLAVLAIFIAVLRVREKSFVPTFRQAFEKIGRGDYNFELPALGWNETLDNLVNAINVMAGLVGQRQAQLTNIINSIPLPMLLETAGRVTYVNPSLNDECGGRFREEDMPVALEVLLQALRFDPDAVSRVTEAEKGDKVEVQVNAGKTSQRYWDVHVGQVKGTMYPESDRMLAFWDVTAIRSLSKMKSELIGTAAHELRTPLSIIRGYAELLRSGRAFTEQQREEMEVAILDRADLLNKMLSELLDIARIDAGRPIPLVVERVDLTEIVRQHLRMFPISHPAHQLEADLYDGPVIVSADRDRLGQVLNNLLGNAAKFSEPGSLITVKTRLGDDAFFIDIIDEGVGVSEDDLPKIFDRFFRSNASTTAPSGTGIGLAVVKTIVESHGGRMEVRSKPGKGSTFTVVLPKEEKPRE